MTLDEAIATLIERQETTVNQGSSADFHQLQERAEKYINQKDRRSYRQAIKFLREAKAICTTEQQRSDWHNYMTELRSRYGHLKALWDEMKKADL